MRIVCPNCAARYEVPESLLGAAARPVRCARCATEWVPETESPPTPPPVVVVESDEQTLAGVLAEHPYEQPDPATPARERVPLVPPTPVREVVVPRAPAGRFDTRRVVAGAWAASVLLMLLLLAAAYVCRAQVQAAWPPSQRAYAMLGLR